MKRLGLLAVVILVAACGGSSTPSLATPAPRPPDPAAGLPYSCGGHPFDIRLLSLPPVPPEANLGGDDAAAALRDAIGPNGMQRGWWLTYRSATEAEFLTTNGPDLFDYMTFRQRADGTWGPHHEGDCVAVLLIDGVVTVQWVLNESLAVGPETRVIRAIVSESCVPDALVGRLQPPIIRLTAEAVLVVFTALPAGGEGRLGDGRPIAAALSRPGDARRDAQRALFDHCASGPPLEVEVDLGERLGDRLLVDGARWPARDARQPVEP